LGRASERHRPPFPRLTSAVGNGLDSVDRDKSVYDSESTSVGVPSAEPKELNGRQRRASPPDGTYKVKPTHAAIFWQMTAHAAALATEVWGCARAAVENAVEKRRGSPLSPKRPVNVSSNAVSLGSGAKNVASSGVLVVAGGGDV